MREKLIELLTHDDCPLFMVFGDNMEGLADYLIAKGVTIPVQCKDCRMFEENTEARTRFCRRELGYMYATPNGFCSYGERRADE